MDVSLVNGLYLLILLLSTLNFAKSASNPITMCYKPKFFIENNCNNPHAIPPDLEVSESIFINVSRMPFDTDLWLHIDVMPTPLAVDTESTIKIQFAMLQITDIDNRFMGRVAEQVPCNVQKYQGEHQYQYHTGEMSELYNNPGRKHIHIFECPFSEDLSFNVNPTVPVLEFTKPVEGFYINVKLTKTEMECIRDEAKKNRIFITTILVDDAGACHLHRLNDVCFILN
ncbi:unnamed protein product [Orchesella dallaii]|uniref:Uncharacterized protein n=1 Tax=Orchesella dallaii TaxID=48710 RepID=A0ABP1REN3_9HEXA